MLLIYIAEVQGCSAYTPPVIYEPKRMMLPGRRLAEDICYSMLQSATVSLDRSEVTRKGDNKTEVPRGLLLERSFGSRWMEAVRCVPSTSPLHSLSGSPQLAVIIMLLVAGGALVALCLMSGVKTLGTSSCGGT